MIRYFIFVAAFYVLAVPRGGNAGIADNDEFDALTFLERTGYLDDLDPSKNRQHAPDNVKQALKEYQTFNRLPVTGRLDQSTVTMMRKPRCGVPDVIKPSLRPNNRTDPNAPLAYTTKSKWHKTFLTIKFGSYAKRNISREDQRRTILLAASRWSDVTPLKFELVSDTEDADIVIEYATRVHGDGYPFTEGVLAHAFSPGTDWIAGDIHFNNDLPWTADTMVGQNLFQTAVHELGHALGLGHSDVKWVTMYPTLWGYIEPPPYLYEDDINGIQSLYGPNPNGLKPQTGMPLPTDSADWDTTPAPPLPTPRPTHRNPGFCDLRFDAIEQVEDGSVFGFAGDDLYQFTGHTSLYNKVSHIYRGGPTSPGAVVYDRVNKHLYFFKGSQYWRFTRNRLDRGYPKTLGADFHNIDAATQKWDNRIYVFQGGKIAQWAEGMTSYSRGFPRDISRDFPSGPSGVDTAFYLSNGHLYLFKDKKYWSYVSDHRRNAVLEPNFPKDLRPYWLNCGLLKYEDRENLRPVGK